MRLTSAGAVLRDDATCRCRASRAPHVHRWMIECPICGYIYTCDDAKTYELPAHLIVRDPSIPDDEDDFEVDAPTVKKHVPEKRPCTGSGFRLTARLGVWEIA